ncbi:2TM domain-containing protein [Pseudomarimonas salicorniae]|uniref:2TM domain-containing protein n=1 Tax=Pseudomarimonas salicorniae TaxID=2933270 RepID=A0ABT0GKK6_9GAMM|nr:2TM domain-containing protein [Lysobacter sp. CAU 1642]MCK7595066.1 2TM domain-containing protein [Lysobacter sp. CAU 1642]
MNPLRTVHEAITLPFKAIGVIALCFVINLMTSPGVWWVQWVVLGMGIAVISAWWRAAKLAGFAALLAGLAALLWTRRQPVAPGGSANVSPPAPPPAPSPKPAAEPVAPPER